MIRITIDGMPGFDGGYVLDLDAQPLTNRELHWIKKLTDVRLGEFEEAAEAGDNDLMVAFAVVALVRAGRATKQNWQQVGDFIFDAPSGSLTVEDMDEEEPPEEPPAIAPVPPPPPPEPDAVPEPEPETPPEEGLAAADG